MIALDPMADGDIMDSFGKPKVLVVDDRSENLLAMARLLADMPLDLYRANSGNEALRLTLNHDFALALLDIQMPDMDGYELAEILRAEEKTARMPLIFVSAIYTDPNHVFEGYAKGAFSFITKPFEPHVLTSKIEFFIEKYQKEQALKHTHALLERKVAERTAELVRSNRDLEQFAYVASHDLQEPLRSITSFLQLLQLHNEGQLDQKSNRYVDVAIDGAMRMKDLIEALLAYARVGSSTDRLEDVDVRASLNKVMEDLRMRIADSGAVIKIEAMPSLNAHPIDIQLLFQNLISNAIKFRREDTTPVISCSAQEEWGQWHFRVADNGIGIGREYHEKVFVIFQRLHTRKEYEGTGIGLAVCKKIVERHKGRIWLVSNPAQGTTVHFTLPSKQQGNLSNV